LQRWQALQTERLSWFDHYKDISQYLSPRTGRFLITGNNIGSKKHNLIYDNTGTRSLRVLSAGLMAGMTSPARPWFRLGTSDPAMMKSSNVKIWLEAMGSLMRDIFAKSNTYRALHQIYEELSSYGTAANVCVPDFTDVLRHYPLTAGQYAIATDDRDEVDTLYREFQLTVSQIVGQFVKQPGGALDWSVCSTQIKNLYDRGMYDTWVPVLHAIQPNADYDPQLRNNRSMKFSSCYIETGANNEGRFLRESGYKRFPALCPRWMISGGDVMGSTCPGIEALGDIKQLQHAQLRKSQGIDYMVKPPVQAPPGMKGMEIDTLPGGVSYTDATAATGGIKTLFDVKLELSPLLEDIQDVRQRVKQSFYEDLFLMLANDTTGEMTAREVAERHEEKMLMLGPVLERLQNELLKPLIDIAFDRIIETGIGPPVPKELQGMDVNIEFVSVLAQAQRAVGTSSVDRLLGTVAAIAQFKPEVVDKIDTDETIDRYADMLGVDPNLIVADDKVAAIRQDRAKQQAAAQAAQNAPAITQSAKNLAQAGPAGQNAVSDLINNFSGYTLPQGAGA
jgi:hypothetical protein